MPIGAWDRTFWNFSCSGSTVDTRLKSKSTGAEGLGFRFTGDIHYPWQTFGAAQALVTPTLSEALADEPRLRNECVARAKGSEWDVATFLAEADKTANLVRGAFRRTRQRALDILGARGPGRVVRTFYEFTQAWLEYRYGWRLLAYDVNDALESYRSLGEVNHRLHRYTSHGSYTKSSTSVGTALCCPGIPGGGIGAGTTIGGSGLTFASKATNTCKTDVRYGAGVLDSFLLPYSINPVVTLWEILPWSFLIDMFVDVGNALAATTPTLGKDLAYVWRSRKTEVKTEEVCLWQPVTGSITNYYTVMGSPGGSRASLASISYSRIAVSEVPFSLNFTKSISLPQLADLASLFINQDAYVRSRLRV